MFASEAIMSVQSLASFLQVPARERQDRSSWQRLLSAIEARQQRRATREIARYLRARTAGYRDEFAIELERRFLGQ
jgi:hypothetical protein